MEFILSWIRTIVTYLILIAVILNVIPSDQYKRYVRLFFGVILVLLIARPLLVLFQDESFLNGYFDYYKMIINEENTIPELEEVDKQRKQAVLEAWKTQIKEDLEVYAKEKGWHITELELSLNNEEETAKIQQMQIHFEKQEEEDRIIAPVVITKGENVNTEENEIQQWKAEIAKKYELDENCIIIRQV